MLFFVPPRHISECAEKCASDTETNIFADGSKANICADSMKTNIFEDGSKNNCAGSIKTNK